MISNYQNGVIYICFVIFILTLIGCKKSETYTYSPILGITFNIVLKEVKPQPEHKSLFLYFDLKIENESSKHIFFNPADMEANLNGAVSKSVYYNSLASVIPEKKELAKGVSNYRLYFVFKGKIDRKISSFVITNFGLSE